MYPQQQFVPTIWHKIDRLTLPIDKDCLSPTDATTLTWEASTVPKLDSQLKTRRYWCFGCQCSTAWKQQPSNLELSPPIQLGGNCKIEQINNHIVILHRSNYQWIDTKINFDHLSAESAEALNYAYPCNKSLEVKQCYVAEHDICDNLPNQILFIDLFLEDQLTAHRVPNQMKENLRTHIG